MIFFRRNISEKTDVDRDCIERASYEYNVKMKVLMKSSN